MEYKNTRKTNMVEGSSRHQWSIPVYEHEGMNYVLSQTYSTEEEANKHAEKQRKNFILYNSNEKVVVMEELSNNTPVWRVYISHYN